MKQIIFTAILILAFCFVTFAQANENFCPTINISTRNQMANKDEIVFFIAVVGKEIDRYDAKYHWKTLNAEILEGQGTRIIRVLRKSNDSGTVGLEIKGLPENCGNTAAEAIPSIDPPNSEEIDEFGEIPTGELRARLDNFLSTLQNDPTSEGLVIISSPQNPVNKLRLYDNHFKFRNFDQTRISFMLINESPQKTRLFIIPAGANSPTFENGLIIKAEEFDKLYNLFRPKPITKKRKK